MIAILAMNTHDGNEAARDCGLQVGRDCIIPMKPQDLMGVELTEIRILHNFYSHVFADSIYTMAKSRLRMMRGKIC